MMFTMEWNRATKIALACGTAMALQGCIAAAFPIAAAGGLMARGGDGEALADAGSDAVVAEAIETRVVSVEPTALPPPVSTSTPTPIPTPEPVTQAQTQTAQLSDNVEIAEVSGRDASQAIIAEETTQAVATAETAPPAASPPAPPPPASPPSVSVASAANGSDLGAVSGVESRTSELSDDQPVAILVQSLDTQAPANPAPVATPVADPVASPVPTRTTNAPGTGAGFANIEATPSVEQSSAAGAAERLAELASTGSATQAIAAPPPQPRPAPQSPTSASTGGLVPVPSAPPVTAGATFFDALFSYSSAPNFMDSGERPSATLFDPTALKADRVDCTQGQSTVLIDLDPEEGQLLPIDTSSASPAFAAKVAQLRERGIAIAWISQNAIDKSAEIRLALAQSGLDPQGVDELLLMRTLDERKQTRRDQLAQSSCLIAIAGDERSDFHELYDYLLNPLDAASLEPMIGEGWFLIPTPLITQGPAQ